MNIFTPRLAHLTTAVPVLVFFHGGNFKQVRFRMPVRCPMPGAR